MCLECWLEAAVKRIYFQMLVPSGAADLALSQRPSPSPHVVNAVNAKTLGWQGEHIQAPRRLAWASPFLLLDTSFPHPHTMELVGDVSQSTHTDTPASGERHVHPDPTLIDRWVLRMSEGVQSMGRR